MILRLKRLYIMVSPFILIIIGWAIFTDKVYSLVLCFVALIFHESGHIAMIYLLKERIAIFRILPVGFSCRLKNQSKVEGKKMIKILIAGPVVNFFTAGLLFLWTKEFALINVLLGMFNLLPVGELDGARIFQIVTVQLQNNMLK